MKRITIFLLPILVWSCASSKTVDDRQTVSSQEQIVFSSNFESEIQSCWSNRPNSGGWNFAGCGGFSNIGSGASVALAENEVSHSGNKALKITFNLDEDYGGAEVRFPDSNHVFTRYYDYYSNNFDFAFGMKTQRIRSFNEITQTNDFDILTLAWGKTLYSDEVDMRGTNSLRWISINSNGGEFDWGGDYSDDGYERGKWYCVETEVKLNTPGRSDGWARLWVDGALKAEKTNISNRGTKTVGLNMVLFGGWYSNSAGGKNPQPNPESASIRYIDDIAISDNRVGCAVHN